MSRSIRVILGTMSVGKQVDAASAEDLVRAFLSSGHSDIDTAYTYVDGATEQILGPILTRLARMDVAVATKANPAAMGTLSPEAVAKQLDTSLSRLSVRSVGLFYLHQPDPQTPVETTLQACNELARQGKFRELGVSNYPAWQVAHIVHVCRREGWVAPTVYQGMYNAVTRDVERELFPCLRELGMRFYAYNPLAGGLLSGRYSRSQGQPSEGRFSLFPFYMDRYWKPGCLAAAERIRKACQQAGIRPVRAALRWMVHHSALDAGHGDGVIIGASSRAQLDENLAACAEPPLPPAIVDVCDEAWQIARPDCPKYFRP